MQCCELEKPFQTELICSFPFLIVREIGEIGLQMSSRAKTTSSVFSFRLSSTWPRFNFRSTVRGQLTTPQARLCPFVPTAYMIIPNETFIYSNFSTPPPARYAYHASLNISGEEDEQQQQHARRHVPTQHSIYQTPVCWQNFLRDLF